MPESWTRSASWFPLLVDNRFSTWEYDKVQIAAVEWLESNSSGFEATVHPHWCSALGSFFRNKVLLRFLILVVLPYGCKDVGVDVILWLLALLLVNTSRLRLWLSGWQTKSTGYQLPTILLRQPFLLFPQSDWLWGWSMEGWLCVSI